MSTPARHADRRRRLHALHPGPILLSGNGVRDRTLPGDGFYRQDSTFLYFTGSHRPDSAIWIEDGRTTLYAVPPDPAGALWHGPEASLDELAAQLGVDAVAPLAALEARARRHKPATLAVADTSVNARVGDWLDRALAFGPAPGDPALVDAVTTMRRIKDDDELDAMRQAAAVTVKAHRLAMQVTRPGVTEAALTAVFEGVLTAAGCTPGYGTILTQDGHVLHHHGHEGTCADGRLLLLDGGAEIPAGYGADVTRTWPVSGTFTGPQRDAYAAVLEAQEAGIAQCRAGVRYREVHLAASRVIARFLLDEGLLKGADVDTVVERGAHALFFPHGIGHLLGLDVHDLEAFGDRAAYPPGASRDPRFGLSYLRLDLPQEAGWVVTVEPGFYVVPAILADDGLRGRFDDLLDRDVLARWEGFGGIRIEDDVVITDGDPEVLTEAAPKAIAEVEAVVGTGAPLEALWA